MADKLDAGATFPDMTLQFTDGSSRNLPTELDRPWTLVLFYRGHW
jgi:peroxiredoxin